MIQVCYYKGCGAIYGEKEPLSDKTVTHGLCPLHTEVSLRELRSELERLNRKAGRFNVLVVEDNALFRQLLKEILNDPFPSMEICEAADGKEALEKLEAFRPDLIFMDIRLPGETGLDLTKKIKAQYPDIMVIILTGYDLPEYRDVSRQCADYFFSKDSATTETIIALVQSILPENT
jgi:CheY-like chemotaxis protein